MSDETENTENPEGQDLQGGESVGDVSQDAMPQEGVGNENESVPSMHDHIDDIMNGMGGGGFPSGLPDRELQESHAVAVAHELNAVYDVPVQLSAVLGRANMPVNQLLKIGRGAVIELDRRVGEAVDIYVNNKLVARGEVVLVEDRLGVTMTEIIKADRA